MFSPDQVQRWKDLVRADAALYNVYCRHVLGYAELASRSSGPAAPHEKYVAGMLQPPQHIFGTPHDGSCLEGIGAWPIHSRALQSHTFANARIIGNSALLTEDWRLYTPEEAATLTRQEFIDLNSYGHQGFLVDDAREKLSIRFAQREVPRAYRMNAVFVHNIEPSNYGSFVYRQLPQLFALRDAGLQFDCYISSERTAFLLEAIELLNLPRKPIFSADEVSGDRFDSITFYQLDDAEGFLSPDFRKSIQMLVDDLQIAPSATTSAATGAIYVSRSLSAMRRPWYRVMTNESFVEDAARARGIEVVYPEILTLRQQIHKFADASRVIGPSGSGMFNVAFSRRLSRVVDIETYHVTVRQHAKLYASCGAEYSFLFVPYAGKETDNSVHRSSFCSRELLTCALDWLLDGH